MTRIEAIRQALADRPAILRTHWEGCDTEARHADCAIAFLLDELERRDAALCALVEQWKARAAWHGAHGETSQQGESEYCIEALSRLLEHEP